MLIIPPLTSKSTSSFLSIVVSFPNTSHVPPCPDSKSKDGNGMTAIMHAKNKHYKKIVEMIEEYDHRRDDLCRLRLESVVRDVRTHTRCVMYSTYVLL